MTRRTFGTDLRWRLRGNANVVNLDVRVALLKLFKLPGKGVGVGVSLATPVDVAQSDRLCWSRGRLGLFFSYLFGCGLLFSYLCSRLRCSR